MKTTDVSIPEPCAVDWDTMTGDERRRFCSHCDKHVTQLSTFTKPEAKLFLLDNPGACIQMDVMDGTILFEPEATDSGTFRRKGWLRRMAWLSMGLATATPALAAGDAQQPAPVVERSVEWVKSVVSSWIPEVANHLESVKKVVQPTTPPLQILGGAPMPSPAYLQQLEKEREELKQRVKRNQETQKRTKLGGNQGR